MPNIADSVLRITGPSTALDSIEQLGYEDEPQILNFHLVRPLPQELLDEHSLLNRAAAALRPYLMEEEEPTPELLGRCLDAYAQASEENRSDLSLESLKERFPALELSASVQHRAAQVPMHRHIPWWMTATCLLWGTKAGAYDGKMKRVSAEELHIALSTAWAPPNGIVHELVRRFGVRIRLVYSIEQFNGAGLFDYVPKEGDVEVIELVTLSSEELQDAEFAPEQLPDSTRKATAEIYAQLAWGWNPSEDAAPAPSQA